MEAEGEPGSERRRTSATAAVTLSEVASRAGVSVSAVSKVLRGTAAIRVSPETRQRILDAAQELRYRPNFAARALQAARTQVLGLVVPDLTNALFTELMHGVEDGAAAHGYTVLLGRLDTDRPQTEVIARLLGEGRVDGLVLQATDGVDPDSLDQLLDPRAAVVLINSVASGRASSVTVDDVGGARTATEHLVSLGHTRIALAGGLPTSYTAQRRRRGHQEAMRAAGLVPREDHETALGYTAEQGREALRRLLRLDPRPTAVVVANVNAAIGLLAEAHAQGVDVPGELSVATVLDSWTAENTWPPLTAVRMQFYAMGERAVASVVRRLEDGAMTEEVVLDPPPELVVRGSTVPPRT
ncbi:transcriptional regulator, LacI family [Microlunatus sagamiharensis]|uniref:Transcriptional regulator, LacI family n=1 Tax=Microlunatus sagamiharensis TaxID=546874 RepID=A0A1H2MF19_9ACTN|nr:LacI family DNA-binding transcriptional regulator [Microlunatus sagamiharensis]SDU91635.1 transcriptional regulator, LacI family [Microlunatus sagamiharensis]